MAYFSAGLVSGPSFAGRDRELELLSRSVRQSRNIWLQSGHREGKSSLLWEFKRLAEEDSENSLAVKIVDLRTCSVEMTPEKMITAAATELAAEIVAKGPLLRHATRSLKSAFQRLSPSVNVEAFGFNVGINPDGIATSEHLSDALSGLDKIAEDNDVSAALIIDSMEILVDVDKGQRVETALRSALERSKSISAIFSGALPELLQQAYEYPTRPLYQICRPMLLGPITQREWTQFINEATQARFGFSFPKESVKKSLQITNGHPDYVARLYLQLLDIEFKGRPSVRLMNNIIDDRWGSLVRFNLGSIRSMVGNLSIDGQKMIQMISNAGGSLPNSTLLADGQSSAILNELTMCGLVTPNVGGSGVKITDPMIEHFCSTKNNLLVIPEIDNDISPTSPNQDVPAVTANVQSTAPR
jgi:hypothetical protein